MYVICPHPNPRSTPKMSGAHSMTKVLAKITIYFVFHDYYREFVLMLSFWPFEWYFTFQITAISWFIWQYLNNFCFTRFQRHTNVNLTVSISVLLWEYLFSGKWNLLKILSNEKSRKLKKKSKNTFLKYEGNFHFCQYFHHVIVPYRCCQML